MLAPEHPRTTTSTRNQRSRALIRVFQVLPVVSALALLIAPWLPWMTIHVEVSSVGNAPVMDASLYGFIILRYLVERPSATHRLVVETLEALWAIAPLVGLMLGLFHLRGPRVPRLVMALYGTWLALVSAVNLLLLIAVIQFAPQSCAPSCSALPVTYRQLEPGLWLALGGLAVGWLAFGGLLYFRDSMNPAVHSAVPIRRSPQQRVGAAIYTLGAAAWALGLLAVPWATSGCSGVQLSLRHFVRSACSGIDGYDALSAAPGSNALLLVLLIAVLATIGVYLVVIAWLPQLTRATWLWIGSWNLFVTLVLFDGIAGVRAAIAHPPRLVFAPQSPWGPSLGIAVCAAGILLGWVAVVVLARAEHVVRSQGDAAAFPAQRLAKE